MHGNRKKVPVQFPVTARRDAHGRMPFFPRVLVAAKAVTKALDRLSANVLDERLVQEKLVRSARRDENEKMLEPEELNLCQTPPLFSRSCPLRHVEAVAFDELGIDRTRIFLRRDFSRHIKPVTVGHIRHGQLLNESRDTRGFTTIQNLASSSSSKVGNCFMAQASRKPKILRQFLLVTA